MLMLIVAYCLFANFAHPITPTVIQNLGLHSYMFGVAFAAMSVTLFLFSPLWGKLSQRYGSPIISCISLIGYSGGQFLFMLARSEAGIILARAVAGFFIGGIMVNQLSYIMRNSSIENRSRNLTIMATLEAVFSSMGFLVGGFIGDYSIDLTFIIQCIGLVIIGFLYWFILDDEKTTNATQEKFSKSINPFKAFYETKGLLTRFLMVFFVITVATSFASICYDLCFNFFIKDQFGFPPSYNGLLKAAVGIITLIANSTVCLWLMKKTNIKFSIIPVLCICFVMMLAIVLVKDMVPFIIINVIFFGFNAIYLPLIQDILAGVSKKDNGLLVGLYNSMRSLGMVGGSLFAGFIYTFGPRLAFVSAAVAFFVAIVAAIINYRLSLKEEN